MDILEDMLHPEELVIEAELAGAPVVELSQNVARSVPSCVQAPSSCCWVC